jgi:hypothetical protein
MPTKHREFDTCEVTVYIWTYKNDSHPGHAAVKLVGVPGVEGKVYISWWPGRGASKSNAHVLGSASHGASYKTDMWWEMGMNTRLNLDNQVYPAREGQQRRVPVNNNVYDQQYAQEAQLKIKIPGLGQPGLTYGLNVAKMYEWWQLFCAAPHPTYKFASKYKNCSGVAPAALRAGGADRFATPPTAMIYIDPNQVGKWANQVKAKIARMNANAGEVADQVVLAGENPQAPVTEVMIVADWTTLSNRDMRGATARSDKVKQMDRLLARYHALGAWNDQVALQKLALLGELLDTIHYYLGHKAGSKRGDAVITLGKQVLAVARAKGLEHGALTAGDQHLWTRQSILPEKIVPAIV